MQTSRTEVANQSALLPPRVRRKMTKRQSLDTLWWRAAASALSGEKCEGAHSTHTSQREDATCAETQKSKGGATPQRWLRQR